ncbi:MAG: hypothetical protein ACK4R8_00585 [Thiobacillus sp.]
MHPASVMRAALCTLCLAAAPAPAGAQTPEPRPMVKVDPAARYKTVYDIHSGVLAAGISKGLYYARGLIEASGKQGVHVEICHSVMRGRGWTADDVLPGVTVVHDGYAYIGGF